MLASHAGVFRGVRFSSLPTFVGREEIRAPLKTPAWEARIMCLFQILRSEYYALSFLDDINRY